MQEKLENNFSEVWRLYGKRKMLAPVLQIIAKKAHHTKQQRTLSTTVHNENTKKKK